MSSCILEYCNDEQKSKGMCKAHYIQDYQQKHKEKLREYNKKYRKINSDYLKTQHKTWYSNNKELEIEKVKKYNKTHREQINAWRRGWTKANPDKIVRYWRTHLTKYSKPFHLDSEKFGYMLSSLSKTIRDNDKNLCQVCNSNQDIHAHHILFKENYPKLSLNFNNGVTLCRTHHQEIHRLSR